MSQSSNDTFPTAMHVAILFAIRDTLPAIDKLINSLGRKAKQFSSYKKVGRTHLMDALPVTLGSEFASYTTALTVARDGIVSAKKNLKKLPWVVQQLVLVLTRQEDIEALQLQNWQKNPNFH